MTIYEIISNQAEIGQKVVLKSKNASMTITEIGKCPFGLKLFKLSNGMQCYWYEIEW